MKKNTVLVYAIMIYILILIVQHSFLFIKIQQFTSTKDTTAKAVGELSFCYNHPPTLNYTCNTSIYEDIPYYCEINVEDADSPSHVFDIDFDPLPDLFQVPGGVIDFTPNESHVGNYTLLISVWDYSNCDNDFDYGFFPLEILNSNDPPYLVQPIPNQSWNQGNPLTAFDLDTYFADPDDDPLNYTSTLLTNIQVVIDTDGVVTFVPYDNTWSGTEYVIFFAWDPYMANASSNEVRLIVINDDEQGEDEGSQGSSSGGGGGSSVPDCLPRWYCRPWGDCQPEDLMYRECYDLNNCTSDFGKPNTTEYCEFVHTCYDGIKGPGEEGIDCGGPCPACGTCYDLECNNNEDCTKGITEIPDCGGPCRACSIEGETCFDSICNNNEDCTKGLIEIPDCGGPCDRCPILEQPTVKAIFNWSLLFIILSLLMLSGYLAKKVYPYLLIASKKKKKKQYEERLLLEAKLSESIYDSLSKLENLLGKESIEKVILLFSTIVRRYFKNLFDLSYEFTYEELLKEIKSRNISPTFKNVLTKFFERSLDIEFSGKTSSIQELRAMISEFKHIVTLTSEEPLKDKEKQKSEKHKKLSSVDKLFVKITEAETSLRKGDINESYFKYLRIVNDYKLLKQEEKKKLHGFISRLYEEIKLGREKVEYEEGI